MNIISIITLALAIVTFLGFCVSLYSIKSMKKENLSTRIVKLLIYEKNKICNSIKEIISMWETKDKDKLDLIIYKYIKKISSGDKIYKNDREVYNRIKNDIYKNSNSIINCDYSKMNRLFYLSDIQFYDNINKWVAAIAHELKDNFITKVNNYTGKILSYEEKKILNDFKTVEVHLIGQKKLIKKI